MNESIRPHTHTSTLLLSSQRLPLTTTDHDRSGQVRALHLQRRHLSLSPHRLAPLETRVGLALEHVERPHNRTVPRFSASAARPHLRSPASDIYMASGLDLPPRDG